MWEEKDSLLGKKPSALPSALTALRTVYATLLPDGILPWTKQNELTSTSFLDGIRGVACLIVFFHHITLNWYTPIRIGYGSTEAATNISSMPIIRVWFSGGVMVSVFFVISGYAVSTKAIGLIRQGRSDEALRSISSSTFRRIPRLYIPVFCVTFLIAVMAQTGRVFNAGSPRPAASSMSAQLLGWALYTLSYANILGKEYVFNIYNDVCWTIPVEIRGSFLVFLTCVGLARSSNRLRMVFLVAVTVYWFWCSNSDMGLFSAGMLAAEVHHIHSPAPRQDLVMLERAKPKIGIWRNVCFLLGFIILLWPLSQPWPQENDATTPGYQTMVSWIPRQYQGRQNHDMLFPCLAAIALIAWLDLGSGTWVHNAFCTRLCQWLGKISFSLYLWHPTVMFSVMSRIMFKLGGIYGVLPVHPYVIVAATIGSLPVLLLVSEVSTAVLDRGSVRIASATMKW